MKAAEGSRSGGVVRRRGARYQQVPLWLRKLARHKHSGALVVWLEIDGYADVDGQSFPGRQKLAEELDCHVHTIDRSIEWLVAVGALSVDARFDEQNGGRTTNLYTIEFDDPLTMGGDTPLTMGGDTALTMGGEGLRNKPLSKALTPPTPPADAGGASVSKSSRDDTDLVLAAWMDSVGKKPSGTVIDRKRRSVVEARLRDGHTVETLIQAVSGWKHIPHNRGENPTGQTWNDITLLLRDAANVERFAEAARAASGSQEPGFHERALRREHDFMWATRIGGEYDHFTVARRLGLALAAARRDERLQLAALDDLSTLVLEISDACGDNDFEFDERFNAAGIADRFSIEEWAQLARRAFGAAVASERVAA